VLTAGHDDRLPGTGHERLCDQELRRAREPPSRLRRDCELRMCRCKARTDPRPLSQPSCKC
jgi:hypothetical protein